MRHLFIITTQRKVIYRKKKYCNRNEFHEEYLENMWYNRSRRRVDRILGYVCVSNQKNTMLMNLYKAGYKRKDVFDCLVHYQDEIIKYMGFKNTYIIKIIKFM